MQYIGDASQLHEHYMRRIAQSDNNEMRQFHIGVGPWTGSFITSHVFEPFHRLYPSIDLKLYEEIDDNIHRMLAQKQLDIAVVVHTEVDRVHSSAAWFETRISQHRLIVISKEHSLAGLVSESDHNTLQNPKYIDLRMISLAANNLGIGIISPFYLTHYPFLDRLVFFYSDDPCMQWLLTAEYKTVDPPEPVRHFVQMIRETYQKEDANR